MAPSFAHTRMRRAEKGDPMQCSGPLQRRVFDQDPRHRRHPGTPALHHAHAGSEARAARELLAHAHGKAFIADTGYDSNAFLQAVRHRGMKPVIHPQGGRLYKPRLNRKLYRIRYRVGCFFHSLKRFRAIATRYERSAPIGESSAIR